MKRFVKEYAHHRIVSYNNAQLMASDPDVKEACKKAASDISAIVFACYWGRITDDEAIRAICDVNANH